MNLGVKYVNNKTKTCAFSQVVTSSPKSRNSWPRKKVRTFMPTIYDEITHVLLGKDTKTQNTGPESKTKSLHTEIINHCIAHVFIRLIPFLWTGNYCVCVTVQSFECTITLLAQRRPTQIGNINKRLRVKSLENVGHNKTLPNEKIYMIWPTKTTRQKKKKKKRWREGGDAPCLYAVRK